MKLLLRIVFTFVLGLYSMMGSSQNNTFQKTPLGLKYQIIDHKPNTLKPQIGDLITFEFKITNYKDSVIQQQKAANIPIRKAQNGADVFDVFPFLAQGDSVVCHVETDSIAKYGGGLPPFLPAGTQLKYTFRILEVKSQAELRQAEQKLLMEYAQKNQLKTQTTPSGLIYAITQAGAGATPQKGQKVKVNYVGKLLDGKLFDTSIEAIAKANNKYQEGRPYQPLEFAVGVGQVIKGWDEGIALLQVGTKAVLLIPSELGYGSRGAGGDIPPNSPLIFEIELLGVQ
jgi:FKBP-type peptidyl-prolyl cis-trans isomerase